MHDHELGPIAITLSPVQIDQVLRAAADGRAPGVSALLAAALADPEVRARARRPDATTRARLPGEVPDRRLSRSLLRGLSILTCFDPEGRERGIVELADELDMSASTVHRYALTLLELGLLERSARTRKYRLPVRPPG